LTADIRELALEPSDQYFAAPLENDMFEWHFTIRGAESTEFEGGIYHGRILVSIENKNKIAPYNSISNYLRHMPAFFERPLAWRTSSSNVKFVL
jgi:hypothetical protein